MWDSFASSLSFQLSFRIGSELDILRLVNFIQLLQREICNNLIKVSFCSGSQAGSGDYREPRPRQDEYVFMFKPY